MLFLFWITNIRKNNNPVFTTYCISTFPCPSMKLISKPHTELGIRTMRAPNIRHLELAFKESLIQIVPNAQGLFVAMLAIKTKSYYLGDENERECVGEYQT